MSMEEVAHRSLSIHKGILMKRGLFRRAAEEPKENCAPGTKKETLCGDFSVESLLRSPLAESTNRRTGFANVALPSQSSLTIPNSDEEEPPRGKGNTTAFFKIQQPTTSTTANQGGELVELMLQKNHLLHTILPNALGQQHCFQDHLTALGLSPWLSLPFLPSPNPLGSYSTSFLFPTLPSFSTCALTPFAGAGGESTTSSSSSCSGTSTSGSSLPYGYAAATAPSLVLSPVSALRGSIKSKKQEPRCWCNICGKPFTRCWLLKNHIRTHTGEKPYECNICERAFADKSNLRAHVQTHSQIKPYPCKRCGRAFALKAYLAKHEDSACGGSNSNERAK